MDTRQVVARFEAERQALALMDHPNIAKVLDAGATETGRPYFVMELVRGTRITRYCEENDLPVAGRLKLFVQATDSPRSRIVSRKSQITGDLDWIVFKCLEKDRTRRYETVNDLAQDIERHLNNEPVTAAAPTAFYKLRKFTRRNVVRTSPGSMPTI